ncbi:FAD binding domain-containing protein [Colletotrichum nymphaeae SA-01]|uniref:Delta(24)-sterol reductase n=1 Tax=Colletotrichum nymphaeae SA-01 TaxID=1460502 RepID=A0A135RPY5_9PEZI|nr:FAD binding domain-containing protein [Colletotrichum nymphaeae SA-01]
MAESIETEYRLIKHRRRVSIIAAKARRFARDGIKYRVYHKTTNSTRPSTRQADEIIDISGLDHVITVDHRRRRAAVEPNVTMGSLVTATLKHGLIPAVVPEFPGITVGGAFSGTALESSSFRYGHFEKSVASLEVILGNGNIVTASPVENSDLFSGLAGSCGTLGICTIIEVKLVPARRFVELNYLPVHSAAEALNTIQPYTADTSPVDFVESIMFGPNDGVIITGTMTDEKKQGMPVVRFSRAHDQWFALHVHESVPHVRDTNCILCTLSGSRSVDKTSTVTDLVPTKDYLFRYDRASFWMGVYGQNPDTFNNLTRFLLNPTVKAECLFASIHHGRQNRTMFFQDITLPGNTSAAFLDWVNNNLGIYPVWICPVRVIPDSRSHRRYHNININVRLWGPKAIHGPDDIPGRDGPEAFERFIRDNKMIEQATRDLGGTKVVYGDSYYTEEEFWRIYDKEFYDELRDKWGAAGLPGLWDKLGNPNPTYKEQTSRSKAIIKVLLKRDYLLKK